VCGIRRLKTGPESCEPNLSPYVQNNYRIEVKYIFLEIVHQGLSCGFFSDFSVFFCYFTARLKISDIDS